MPELLVYVNGELVPDSQARISVHDSGFTLGDTVYEAVRTFNFAPFKLDEHLDRLSRSLRYTRIDPGMSQHGLKEALLKTLDANRPMLTDDVFIYTYVSRGVYINNIRHYLPMSVAERPPTIVITCVPLVFPAYARGYQNGVHAIIPSTRHTPPQSLDPKIKTCSRMHLVLAEYEAKMVDPYAWSMILDINGNITENKSSNVFLIQGGEIFTPHTGDILGGITRDTILQLARELGIVVHEADLQPYHALTADEAFFTATGFCIMPVTKINGLSLGDGKPGTITRRLLQAWSDMVGVDIVAQANKYAEK